MTKRRFDIDRVMALVRRAVRPYPQAALFALAEEGYASAFEQVVACILSIRTRDEVLGPVARRLFGRARTPEAMARLTPSEIEGLIEGSRFRERKAGQIHEIARRAVTEYEGEVPCEEGVLRSFAGVGPKCANLVLAIACGEQRIGVDVHVWRVTNRWGVISTRTPEQAVAALEGAIPRMHWVDLNRYLVPFGKHICTGRLPHCSTCPVLEYCRQVGVAEHR